MSKINDNLKQLCIDLLNILEDLRDSGMITEEEYIMHSKVKIDFLNKLEKDHNS